MTLGDQRRSENAPATVSIADLEGQNANLVGGDVSGGYMDLRQLLARPMIRLNPYSTPAEGLYICSSSTPPGGSVHGLCGYFAARAALSRRKSSAMTGARRDELC